jgi:hypothetical protein
MTNRFLIALLSLCGIAIALILFAAHISGTAECPNLFGVPACFVVATGYFLVLISAGCVRYTKRVLFLVGLVPVLALAALASTMELVQGSICPSAYGGLPLCYVSLGLSLLIGGAWLYDLRRSRARKTLRRRK